MAVRAEHARVKEVRAAIAAARDGEPMLARRLPKVPGFLVDRGDRFFVHRLTS
jgi:hypothetical protein